jgi:hypothetical protein
LDRPKAEWFRKFFLENVRHVPDTVAVVAVSAFSKEALEHSFTVYTATHKHLSQFGDVQTTSSDTTICFYVKTVPCWTMAGHSFPALRFWGTECRDVYVGFVIRELRFGFSWVGLRAPVFADLVSGVGVYGIVFGMKHLIFPFKVTGMNTYKVYVRCGVWVGGVVFFS